MEKGGGESVLAVASSSSAIFRVNEREPEYIGPRVDVAQLLVP